MELTNEQKNFSKRLIIEEIKIFCDLHRKNEGIGEQGLDELADIILNFSKNYISKDKIREKIKAFQDVKKTIIKSENKLLSASITYDIVRNDYCEKMLQELLEEDGDHIPRID